MAEGRTDPQRRWTIINEGEHDFAHLSYDGPPIKVGERVEVVAADDQLTAEEREPLPKPEDDWFQPSSDWGTNLGEPRG